MFATFFSTILGKVAIGASALLLIALGLQTWRLSSCNDKLDASRKATIAESLKHSITLQSLKSTTDALNDQNARVVALADAGKRRQQAAAEALREARKASEAVEARARRIEVPRAPTGRCESPSDLARLGL